MKRGFGPWSEITRELQRNYLKTVIEQAGTISGAAKRIGMHRQQAFDLAERLGLKPEKEKTWFGVKVSK